MDLSLPVEKGKEDSQLSEPFIWPAKQPIRRRAVESFPQ